MVARQATTAVRLVDWKKGPAHTIQKSKAFSEYDHKVGRTSQLCILYVAYTKSKISQFSPATPRPPISEDLMLRGAYDIAIQCILINPRGRRQHLQNIISPLSTKSLFLIFIAYRMELWDIH